MSELDTLSLVQLSDLHLLSKPGTLLLGVDTDATFEAVLGAVFSSKDGPVDAVVVSGDIAHDDDAAIYTRAAALLARYYRGPTIWLPGNHDLSASMAHTLPSQREFAIGRWLVIAIDTHVDGREEGFVAQDELDRLARCLAQSQASYALIIGHHPCVKVETPWLDRGIIANAGALLELLERDPRVRGYAFGHIHHGGEFHGATWPILSAPSTCFQFAQGGSRFGVESHAPGCRRFALRSDGVLTSRIVRADAFVVTPDLSKFR